MNKFTTIKDRLIYILEIKNISKNKFYQDTGVTYGILSQKNELKCDTLMKFLIYLPDVNVEWILFEKGSILRKEGEKTTENTEEFVVSEKIFRELLEKNEELNRHIGRLEAELEHCKKAGAPQAEHATFAVAAGEK